MKSKKELLWGRGGIGGTWGYHLIFSDCDPNRDISTNKFNHLPQTPQKNSIPCKPESIMIMKNHCP